MASCISRDDLEEIVLVMMSTYQKGEDDYAAIAELYRIDSELKELLDKIHADVVQSIDRINTSFNAELNRIIAKYK